MWINKIPNMFKSIAHPHVKSRNNVILQTKSAIAKRTKQMGDSALEKSVSDWLAIFSKSNEKSSQQAIIQLDDLLDKFEMCEDTFVKKQVREFILKEKVMKKSNLQQVLDFLENTLDAVNINMGKYCNINKNSKPHQMALELKKQGFDSDLENKMFTDWVKLDSISKLCGNYHLHKNFAYRLWSKYYLNKLPKELQKKLLDIQKKYGTKIIGSEWAFNENNLNLIDAEFDVWLKASKGKAKFPKVLEINPLDNEFIRIDEPCDGYCCGKNIMALSTRFNRNLIDHEMVHLNDSQLAESISKKSKIPEQLANEMKNAGCMDVGIEYAKINLAEKKAVLGQLDMEKLSDKTKAWMEKMGLPKYVMQRTSPFKYTDINAEWEDLGKRITELCGQMPESLKDTFITLEKDSPQKKMLLEKTYQSFSQSKKTIEPDVFTKVYYIESELTKCKEEINALTTYMKTTKSASLKESYIQQIKDYKSNQNRLILEKDAILAKYQ